MNATLLAEARKSLEPLFKAIPKGKFAAVLPDAIAVESGINAAWHLLGNLRRYFLDRTGEGSPFVKEIDKLIPRPQPDMSAVDPTA